MALTSPILDDRSFEQLKTELLQRIPVYTREWTDHNESDPGIALLELFAFLGESVLYRFNQIPETTKIEFLRLLGVRPRPAVAATALLAATTELAAGVPVPRESEVRAGSVLFSTTGATQVWPLELVAVGKTPAPEPDPAALTASQLRAESDRRSDALSPAGLTDADPVAGGRRPGARRAVPGRARRRRPGELLRAHRRAGRSVGGRGGAARRR